MKSKLWAKKYRREKMKEKNGFILEAKNIKKTFITGDSKVEALKGISFCLKKGEMLAVMGGSGFRKEYAFKCFGCASDTG